MHLQNITQRFPNCALQYTSSVVFQEQYEVIHIDKVSVSIKMEE